MISQNPQQQLDTFLALLAQQAAVLVQVDAAQGSAPREAGAWMAVFHDTLIGSVGGGHLEHEAIAKARELLPSQPAPPTTMRFALGPALGQCCGGVVHLRFEPVTAQDTAHLRQRLQPGLHPVALFGGGHVGHALARVLSTLPFALTWIDSRDGVFPGDVPSQLTCEHSDPVEGAVRGLTPQSRVLIMSFSHAEDLEVLAACLKRQREFSDLPYIGLIGSQTKWATFRKRLQTRGFTPDELAHVTSPIGVSGIAGKAPEVIAIAVAAQLLQVV
jgi:xanthine dehydrogenase accessory factor